MTLPATLVSTFALRYNPVVSRFRYKLVETDAELERAFAVRRKVFVEEQGVDGDVEYDGRDTEALQLIVNQGGLTIATARVRFPKTGEAKIERMAVLQPHRGQGIGREILDSFEHEFKARRIQRVVLHAQYPVIAFYEACGYRVTGAPFIEAGIRHVKMEKRLS